MSEDLRAKVIKANIDVHSTLVEVYNQDPHFRPENKQKVRSVLEKLTTEKLKNLSPDLKLVDLGCGTGFIIDLAKDLFHEIHGVDITPAMLNKVDTSSGNIVLHLKEAENTGLPSGQFHMASAYSFMDHLVSIEPFLQEVYRLLHPGGIFFSDQNANRHFWVAMEDLEKNPAGHISPLVAREIQAALHTEEKLALQFPIDKEAFRDAEYIKARQLGIDPEEVCALAKTIGFTEANYQYEWYLGQGSVMHGKSFQISDEIESHLRNLLPLTQDLFKYVRFVFKK